MQSPTCIFWFFQGLCHKDLLFLNREYLLWMLHRIYSLSVIKNAEQWLSNSNQIEYANTWNEIANKVNLILIESVFGKVFQNQAQTSYWIDHCIWSIFHSDSAKNGLTRLKKFQWAALSSLIKVQKKTECFEFGAPYIPIFNLIF